MKKMLFAVVGVLLIALGGGTAVYTLGRDGQREIGHSSQLKENDLGQLRQQALFMFPRGSPVGSASDGLTSLGFRCAPARHLLANINAPSVQCESAGRGFPAVSRTQVTVVARNGMVSDIAVGNGFDPVQADARTPYPPVVGSVSAAEVSNGEAGEPSGKKPKPEAPEKAEK